MASRAAKRVWRPLTSSLLSQGRRCCRVAPMTLSARVASSPTRVTKAQAWGVAIQPRAAISVAMAAAPTALARLPSRLTAPSVPGGTGLKVVISRVRRPQRLPISLPQVSASLALKLAAKPSSSRGRQGGGTRTLAMASTAPTSAEPQTFSGPRRPPRASARPRACLRWKPRRVTSEPRAR